MGFRTDARRKLLTFRTWKISSPDRLMDQDEKHRTLYHNEGVRQLSGVSQRSSEKCVGQRAKG
jgi:hypothetical protein